MRFKLVDGGLDGGGLEEVMELGRGEIGDADLADFGGEEEGGHCVPCLVVIGLAGVRFCTEDHSCYVRQRSGWCSFLQMRRQASA